MSDVLTYLKKHNITYQYFEHPAVFTCEEADVHCKHVPGKPGKNLFLQGKKSKKLYLLSVCAEKRVDLKALAKQVKEQALQFANAERLKEVLHLTPGSVSPFGLLNDKENKVTYIIDEDLWNADEVNFHPNTNTASLALKKEAFHQFVKGLQHPTEIIPV